MLAYTVQALRGYENPGTRCPLLYTYLSFILFSDKNSRRIVMWALKAMNLMTCLI